MVLEANYTYNVYAFTQYLNWNRDQSSIIADPFYRLSPSTGLDNSDLFTISPNSYPIMRDIYTYFYPFVHTQQAPKLHADASTSPSTTSPTFTSCTSTFYIAAGPDPVPSPVWGSSRTSVDARTRAAALAVPIIRVFHVMKDGVTDAFQPS